MPLKKDKEEITEGIRNLLDKVGAAGTGFCVFFGAGASKTVGLPTMMELAEILENKLSKGKKDEINKLISEVMQVLRSESKDGINIEQVLEFLYHVHFLLRKREGKVSLSLGNIETINSDVLVSSIEYIKEIIWSECFSINPKKLNTYIDFLNFFLEESGKLRKLNIFTTNWDFAIEMACDELKYKCVDGFVGVFKGFEKFSTFNELTQDLSRAVSLYKLHGSLNWVLESEEGNLRKITNWSEDIKSISKRFMVYPIPSKTDEILGYPYSEIINLYSNMLNQTNPLLLLIGYNFTDSHIVTKISNMLENNEHSNLFVVDPRLELKRISEVLKVKNMDDERITLLQTGFSEFTNKLKELSKNE